ncbi:MAG: ABC transporter permease subunit [Candidatus Krumholzibacteriia bacterium]
MPTGPQRPHGDSGGRLFTGRKRQRRPRRTVLVVDKLARWMITLGGIGSIVAVSLVGLFLVYVAVPLFIPPSAPPAGELARSGLDRGDPMHLAANEHLTMFWSYYGDGTVVLRRLDSGEVITARAVSDSLVPTAWSFSIEGSEVIFGFVDGTVRLARIDFATEFLPPEEAPPELLELPAGTMAPLGDGMVERTGADQYRLQRLEIELDEARRLSDLPIVAVDRSQGTGGPRFVALDAGGTLHVREVRERRNLLTGEVAAQLSGGELPLADQGMLRVDPEGELILPTHLLLTGIGDSAVLGWPSGRAVRVLTRDVTAPLVAEELDLVPEKGVRLTALAFQLGEASLVSGDELGRVRVWFRTNPEGVDTPDGTMLALAHELPPGPARVTSLNASARTRMIVAGFADGRVDLSYITSDRRLAQVTVAEDQPVAAVALAPRDDHLLAASGEVVALWKVDAPHPETNLQALLGRVWYEGYNEPAFVWQSSAGTDSFEPKYSLVPLIFGTLKATFYSMLFGLPLALAAAIYTSEFLHPRTKSRVKPSIEMMASLPSVVLGFLAALVFAPFVEGVVPETLLAFATVPFAFLLGAHLWQLVPRERQLRLGRWKLVFMFLMLPVGIWLADVLGPAVEKALFAGDIMAWLDGQVGSGTGGWMFLLLPASALAVGMANARFVNQWMRSNRNDWSRQQFALFDVARFLASAIAVIVAALAVSWLLDSAGWDPRGSYVGTYVQRNALIVGFVMGFAIIPIIYTISEDALTAVPDHLRAASLGAGATPWQTAVRVIIPPAMSGLFSATMIGLGRAVGETMIVLMAAGNTPVLDWNVFNGFRTLSANIAVELPEAVQNSTHYRTLFLAALTLFLMTFALNTVAEAIRIRFRKKAFEL